MLRQRSLRVVKGACGFHKSIADVIVGISPFDVWLERTQCDLILDGNRKLPASGDFGNGLRLEGAAFKFTVGWVKTGNAGQVDSRGLLLDALVQRAGF